MSPEAIRAAILGTEGVIAMHPGPHGTAAAFSATGRIWGVRVTDPRIDVHIVADQERPLVETGRAVRRSVQAAAPDYAGDISIHIEDIAPPTTTRIDATDATDASDTTDRDPQQTRRTS